MTATAAGRGRGVGDNVLRNAARGAALIGVAVVIGIVLLQVVDKGSPGGGSGGSTPTVATNASNGNTTTTHGGAVRPPQQVRLLVQNGSGVAQAASTLANTLRGLGYQIAGTGNAPTQAGTTVECKSGFDKEAGLLAKAVGTGAAVAAFPATPPAGSDQADCIVIKGT